MKDLGFYEKVVQPPAKSKHSFRKAVVIAIYIFIILSCVLSMFISQFVPAFIAIVIATLLLYFFVGSLNYEYEYSFSEAGVTLAKIYAKKRRRELFELSEDEILFIAPVNDDNDSRAESYAPKTRYEIFSPDDEGALWMIVFEVAKGERAVLIFRAEDEALKVLKTIKPSVMKFR